VPQQLILWPDGTEISEIVFRRFRRPGGFQVFAR
jgi:hypothetical protein